MSSATAIVRQRRLPLPRFPLSAQTLTDALLQADEQLYIAKKIPEKRGCKVEPQGQVLWFIKSKYFFHKSHGDSSPWPNLLFKMSPKTCPRGTTEREEFIMQKLPTGVRKRKTGLLEKRFSVNGSRYSVYGKTLRELSVHEQKKRNQIAAAAPLRQKFMTLDQYFEMWLEGKKMSVKPSTIRVYTTYYRPYASPVIGSLPLPEITRRDVLRVQCEAAKKLCPTTNNILLTVIKIILNEAVEDKLIIENPAKGVKPVKVTGKASETYHRALTETEQEQFMAAAKDNFYYELLAFQLLTGMRLGEVGALYWTDIDEEMNVIHVRRTITRTEDGIFCIGDSPKSDAGVRDIPMNDGIKKLLKQQRKKQETMVQRKNIRQGAKEQRLCFQSPTGRMIGHSPVNKNIRNILCALEQKGIHMEPFTSHALRDTFATRYIEQGGNPQTLKTILGHSSLSITMDLYSHVLPNTRQEEMDRIVIKI